jgi:anti-sigma factor RsiW
MPGCLTSETLARYRAGELDHATELRGVEAHLDTCAACSEALETAVSTGAAAFGTRFAAGVSEQACPDEEALSRYALGEARGAEADAVATHLPACPHCAADVADLRDFRSSLNEYDWSAVPPRPWTGRLRMWLARAPHGRLVLEAAGMVAAGALGALAVFWFGVRPQQQELAAARAQITVMHSQLAAARQPGPEQGETGGELVLNDAGRWVRLDKEGKIGGLSDVPTPLRRQVQTALVTQALAPSSALTALRGGGETLRAGPGAGMPFALREPVGTVVRSSRPTLRWQAVPEASGYVVTIVDQRTGADAAVSSALPPGSRGQEMAWRLPRTQPELRPGQIYGWRVTAMLPEGARRESPGPSALPARFKVLDPAAARQLDRQQRASAGSHLALAVLYTRAGLIDEAEGELRQLLAANPESAVARKLLASLEAMRSSPAPADTR